MLTAAMIIMTIVTFLAGFPVYHLLRTSNRLDHPNHRSSHVDPTPRGGGLAILVALAGCALFVAFTHYAWDLRVWTAVLGVAGLAALGFADDVAEVDPRMRLSGQVFIGALAGLLLGGWLGAVLGAIVVPAAVNMVNFMDGINGLCAGHAAVWGGGALAAGALSSNQVLTVLGAVSLGGALGFLPWNAPRARMFLGDVGSYLLGGLAGIGVLFGLIELIDSPSRTAWKVLALLSAPYLLFALDTATTIARRARRGENLFEAHRDHIYQRLVNGGDRWPHWAVSLGAAVLSMLVTAAFAGGWLLGVVTAVVVGALYLSSPRVSPKIKEVAL